MIAKRSRMGYYVLLIVLCLSSTAHAQDKIRKKT